MHSRRSNNQQVGRGESCEYDDDDEYEEEEEEISEETAI